jgi:dolichol-phosphate mannosyltransferase
MANKLKTLVLIPALNEQGKIDKVLNRIPRSMLQNTIVVDDGSLDDTPQIATSMGVRVIRNSNNNGVGSALKKGFEYFLENQYQILVIIAGNNKDFPENLFDLVNPIQENGFEIVQGSRYLHSNRDFGEMPIYRLISTRVHSYISSLLAGQKITDSTNGFRAYSRNLVEFFNSEVQDQKFDGYALEPYMLIRSCLEGFKFQEIPARKVYSHKSEGQTKIKPISGWLDLLYPFWLVIKFKTYRYYCSVRSDGT